MLKIFLIMFLVFTHEIYAEERSSTNIQFLYGNDFDKVTGGDSINDGVLKTITIEHAGTWKYGNNFFFIDMTSADYASNKTSKIYAEWAPKISLSKLTDRKLSYGIIKDISLAGEINQGDNFRAYNGGIALALNILDFKFFDCNIFYRDDNFNDPTYQLTLAWLKTFNIFTMPLRFEGFFDYYGVDSGSEVVTQPRLLIEGKYFSKDFKQLQAGVELYYYKSSANARRKAISETVPQLMIKWVW